MRRGLAGDFALAAGVFFVAFVAVVVFLEALAFAGARSSSPSSVVLEALFFLAAGVFNGIFSIFFASLSFFTLLATTTNSSLYSSHFGSSKMIHVEPFAGADNVVSHSNIFSGHRHKTLSPFKKTMHLSAPPANGMWN